MRQLSKPSRHSNNQGQSVEKEALCFIESHEGSEYAYFIMPMLHELAMLNSRLWLFESRLTPGALKAILEDGCIEYELTPMLHEWRSDVRYSATCQNGSAYMGDVASEHEALYQIARRAGLIEETS